MDDKPLCNLRCSVCRKPDCDYDGDYVSRTERDTAQRNDKRAIWYRKTWHQIAIESNRHKKYERRKGRKNGTHETLSSCADGESDYVVL